ncbi:VWA domain-containing protein [Pseudoxanthomonas sp. SGNA-20]|uniref:tetratricopeptide repeat protein n=1 Tax=Pseudoxanthomonas sp. SGNA-20 TaxID=2493088 RepID=UPI000F62D6EB|nr:tetratricopeptide repeat protein [Pseudoxanthomonas sp. SGNA-20]RRN58755.1 VWA domain-containing protein [Pseudoxanthomonas sp. SGNA-20]
MSAWLPLLHFQRPLWLWALLLLPLLWVAWGLRRDRDWRGVVDPHLLPALLVPGQGRAWLRLAGVSLALLLAILALAGPGWRQQGQPLVRPHMPLVVALELSAAIATPDLPPSRLAHARLKLERLLHQRRGGEIGLVAWAEDAYTVAPLTADTGNIALFLDALAPDVMPADGQRADRAITQAATLLRQAGFERGQILLLAAGADERARQIAAATAASGYEVSVLGLGTPGGGAYRDSSGRLRTSQRDDAALRALAAAGQGRYAPLAMGDADLQALGVLQPVEVEGTAGTDGALAWLDQGYWLLLPLLLLGALAFRRGAPLLALVLLLGALPATPALAQDSPWLRPDQQAQRQLQRGVEAYRRGDFTAAAEAFAAAGARGAEAQYNLGNALARQGRYEEALQAYDRALAQAPGMEDARANRQVVEAAMRRQPPQGGGGQSGDAGQSGKDPAGRGRDPADDPRGNSQAGGQDAPPQPPARERPQPGGDGEGGQEDAAQARARQEQADREQRERMRQALERRGQEEGQAQPVDAGGEEQRAQREQRQAHEAWLQRVPDDPGGLLRAKFRLEHERRQQEGR